MNMNFNSSPNEVSNNAIWSQHNRLNNNNYQETNNNLGYNQF